MEHTGAQWEGLPHEEKTISTYVKAFTWCLDWLSWSLMSSTPIVIMHFLSSTEDEWKAVVCPCSGCSRHSSRMGIVLALGFKFVTFSALIKKYHRWRFAFQSLPIPLLSLNLLHTCLWPRNSFKVLRLNSNTAREEEAAVDKTLRSPTSSTLFYNKDVFFSVKYILTGNFESEHSRKEMVFGFTFVIFAHLKPYCGTFLIGYAGCL